MAHYVIYASVCVSVKLAPSGRPGYVPVEKQLKPDWHQSSAPVPWLTGCANREQTGGGWRHEHEFVLEMPPRAPCYPSQTMFGYAMQICQHHFHSEGEDIHKDTEIALGVWFFFLLRYNLKHLMEQWERLPFTL